MDDLRSGVVTEDVVPPSILDDIRQMCIKNDMGTLLENVYYYRYASVQRLHHMSKVWYRINLDIASEDTFDLYKLHSLKMPVNETTSVQILAPPKIGIDTVTNTMFCRRCVTKILDQLLR